MPIATINVCAGRAQDLAEYQQQQQGREGDRHVDDAGDNRIEDAADIAGDDADGRADHRTEEDGEEPHHQGKCVRRR